MKRLIYQVCLGEQAKSELYKHCIATVKTYCDTHGIDHKVQTKPHLRISPDPFTSNRSKEATAKHGGFLPIYEKENAFMYLGVYDQVAVIDADVMIREGASNIFDELGDAAFAAVPERSMPLNDVYLDKIRNYSRMQFTNLTDVNWNWNKDGADFSNMGVMLFDKKLLPFFKGQTPKQFLSRFEFKRFIDGEGAWKWSTDQVLLNWWLKKAKVPFKVLDWKYNGLYGANKSIDRCEFVHFFLKDKLPNRGEDVQALLKSIEDTPDRVYLN